MKGNELGKSKPQAGHLRIWSLPAVMLHQSPTACERSALPHWCDSSEQASAGSQAGLACLQQPITDSFICSVIHLCLRWLVDWYMHACIHPFTYASIRLVTDETYVFCRSQVMNDKSYAAFSLQLQAELYGLRSCDQLVKLSHAALHACSCAPYMTTRGMSS